MDEKGKDSKNILDQEELTSDEILELLGEMPKPGPSVKKEVEVDPEIESAVLTHNEIDNIMTEIEEHKEFKVIEEISQKINTADLTLEEINDVINSEEFSEALNTDMLEISSEELTDSEIESLVQDAGSDSELNPELNIEIEESEFNFDFDFDDNLNMDELSSMELEFVNDVSVYSTTEKNDPFKVILEQTEKELEQNTAEGTQGTATINTVGYPEEETDSREILEKYDTKKTEEKENEEKIQLDISLKGNKSSFIAAGILLILIAAVGITGTFAVSSIKKRVTPNNEILVDAPVAVQSEYALDKPNFVYLNYEDDETAKESLKDSKEDEEEVSQAEKEPYIIKFFAGAENTVFYFNKDIKWADFDIVLIDDEGTRYNAEIGGRDPSNIGTKLSFDPLTSKTRGLILTMVHRETKEKKEFPIRINSAIYITPSVYFNTSSRIVQNEDTGIDMTVATFNFSESSINYKIHAEEGNYYDFDRISMETVGSGKKYQYKDIRYYLDENTITGNVKLPPVDNLSGVVSINFEDVYYIYENNAEINPSQLFVGGEEQMLTYKAGGTDIVLERLGKMGPYFILVLHGEDYEGTHIEAIVEAELKFTASNGDEITVKGECKSNSTGTDIKFDTSPYSDSELGMSNIKSLVINSTKLKMGTVTKKISLLNADSQKDYKSAQAMEKGMAYLLAQGFEQAENITYSRNASDFQGVYRTLRNGEVEDYLLEGSYETGDWNFDITKVYKNTLE